MLCHVKHILHVKALSVESNKYMLTHDLTNFIPESYLVSFYVIAMK